MLSKTSTSLVPDEKRRTFDYMLRALLIGLFIFTAVAGFLMMWLQLAHLHWFVRFALSLLYVAACEVLVAVMLYGLKYVFSTTKEISIGVIALLVMVAVITINVVAHFRHAVLGQENNPVVMHWLTWGAAIVPVFGICMGVLLVLVSPMIRRMRAERRRQGKQFEWSITAQTEAYDTQHMDDAREIITDMLAQAEALTNLRALRSQMPPELLPEFDRRVAEKFGKQPPASSSPSQPKLSVTAGEVKEADGPKGSRWANSKIL